MARTFRLAVLECDKPVAPVVEARGTYGEIFRQLLTKGKEGLGSAGDNVDLQISKWDVVTAQEYPNVEDLDGLLISGSKHTSFGDDPWNLKLVEFVKKVLTTTKLPVVGICYGHQIVARALGAKLGVSPGGWEISVHKVDLNEHGQKLLGVPSISLHQMHRDAVLEIPDGAVCLGSSPRCEIQGLYQEGKFISFQAHPETDGFIMNNTLNVRHDMGIFNDEMFKDGIARADKHHDGVLVATAIWKFLLA